MIWRFCKFYGLPLLRRYKRQARKTYLAFAKSKKHTAKKVRAAIRKQLGYVRRDLGYVEQYMSDGRIPDKKEIPKYLTILKLYEQQKYMYDHKVHSVADRIVSISQPWLRPIARGKVTAPVEFGAKFDLSLDTEGLRKYPSIRITRVQACGRLWNASGNAQGIIRKGYWRIRYTEPAGTKNIVKNRGSGYPGQNWEGQARQPHKQIKSRHIRIIQIG